MDKLEKLKSIGCNVDEGLNRCLNNQDFYLRLLIKAMDDNKIETLKNAILNNNLKEAFEISHSLKGVYANLALTPIYNIIYELTEYLRKEEKMDYSSIINDLIIKYNDIKNIIKD